jgi:L-lactate dehydrogenase complex protein LldF
MGRKRGRFGWLPLAGAWTAARDMPAPEGETFFARYAREQRSR